MLMGNWKPSEVVDPKHHLDEAKHRLATAAALAAGVNHNHNELAYEACGKAVDALNAAVPGVVTPKLQQARGDIFQSNHPNVSIPDLIAEIEPLV